jgi:hypothetical protein
MGKGSMPEGLKTVLGWVVGLASIALIGVIMLILFGNLSGNLGFAASNVGLNNTNAVIGNYTTSVVNTAAQFPTVGTILGVGVLITILIALLIFAISKMMKVSGGGSSNASFG